MVNYKTNDDTNGSCNVKKANNPPPPKKNKLNNLKCDFQPGLHDKTPSKFLSRKGGGFSTSSLVLNSTISTCELECKCRRSCIAVALSSFKTLKVHFCRISCLLEIV